MISIKLRKVASNISWLLIDKVIRMIGGLFVGIWVARYLGPDVFGKLSYAIAFIGLFGSFSAFGLQAIVVRELVKKQFPSKELLSSAFLIQIISAITAYIVCNLLVLLLRDDDYVVQILVVCLSLALLFKSTDFIKYYFEANIESKFIVWIENSIFIIGSIVRIVLILTNASVYSFALLMIFEAVLLAALLLVLYGKKVGSFIWPKYYSNTFFSLVKNSWPLMLSAVTVMMYMRIDQIMLGELIGDSAVGVYSAAIKISEVWYVIPAIVSASLFPSLVEHHQSNKSNYDKSLQIQYETMVYLAILIAIPVTFFSGEIIEFLYGSQFSDAADILVVHIWTGLFVFLGVVSQQWFIAENMQQQALYRTAAGMIANIGLNILLIPSYGGVGAAWATLIAQMIAALFFDLFNRATWPMFRMKMKALLFWRLFYV